MKILLVNPYITDFTAYDLWLRPLGLLTVAGVIKKYSDSELFWIDALDRFQDPRGNKSRADGRGKFHREIIPKPEIYKNIPRNYSRYGIPLDQFLNKINEIPDVDLILITTLMTYWIDGLQLTIQIMRNRFPRSRIIVGGILPSLVSPQILKKKINADLFVTGYGENKILKIIAENNGNVFKHPDLSDINHLPKPAFDLLSNKKILPLLTSRGCPYNCSYCASHILNKRFLEREPENILEEIFFMNRIYGTEHFIIFDDAFLINKEKRFFQVFNQVKGKIDVSFHTPNGLHAKEIDEKTATILFESGFQTVILSFESIKAEILSRSSNKVDVKHMVHAVNNLEKAGFQRKDIAVYLLFGYPDQKVDDIKDSLLFVADMGVVPHLSYFSPVPGTPDFLSLQKKGLLSKEINLYESNKIFFVYNKSGLSIHEIHTIRELTAQISRSAKA